MNPSVADTNVSVEDNFTESHTVALPPNISAGNRLIIGFAHGDFSDPDSVPSGWDEIKPPGQAVNGEIRIRLYQKEADGTEGSSVTFGTNISTRSVHLSHRIPDGGVPVSTNEATGDSNNPNSPSFSPSAGSDDYLWISYGVYDYPAISINSYPSNYSNGISDSSGSVGLAAAYRQLTASSEDPGPFTTNASNHWIGVTVAVPPAQTSETVTESTSEATSPSDVVSDQAQVSESVQDASTPSDAVTETVVPGGVPAAPTGFSVAYSHMRSPDHPDNHTGGYLAIVDLSWTDNADNEDQYRTDRDSGASQQVLPANTTSTTEGVFPGDEHTWRVRAENDAGDSSWSSEVTLRVPELAVESSAPEDVIFGTITADFESPAASPRDFVRESIIFGDSPEIGPSEQATPDDSVSVTVIAREKVTEQANPDDGFVDRLLGEFKKATSKAAIIRAAIKGFYR